MSASAEPAAFAVFAKSEEFGNVMLKDYVGSLQVIRERVMQSAAREGFKGDYVERMAELGWWVEPLYLHPPRVETGWRPMGSAPKDGTRILLAVGGTVVISRWYVHYLNGKPNESLSPEWQQQEMHGSGYQGPLEPIAWQPLPEFPK